MPTILGSLLVALSLAVVVDAPRPDPAAIQDFEGSVRPLLSARCYKCHGPKKQESGLRLDSRAAILAGGESGPAIVPGKPDESRLVQAIRHEGDIQMPPGAKLGADQLAPLVRWIEQGAPWPDDPKGPNEIAGKATPEARAFWSFRPIESRPEPVVRGADWVRSPVDRFILARLEAGGLTPVGPADKRTLIRRATFDLTGLPPTVEEVDAFLADTSPDAFARVVDRLLGSPAYGERWGRHWLDVVRYADTAGETADFPVPEAYKYRNYVIDAFNRDKPYDEFIREQIAGDILAREGPRERFAERVTATGFIAISRRFGFDSENYQHLTIQDTIDTMGQAVLGLTLGCARCHDHKFDPISTEDYYALFGIFASTEYPFPGSEQKPAVRALATLVPTSETALIRQVAGPQTKDSASPEPGPRELAYALAEGPPHDAPIQKRGEPTKLGKVVPRRFLEVLGGDRVPTDAKGSGRRELANWLTRPENPLTARVMVNRIWQHHFGVGIVATENDFGVRGRAPTHPDLLDDLAARFIASGWSVKAIQRLVMLSSTYQLASVDDPGNSRIDPNDDGLWRFRRQRLDAESIRDAILAIGGTLDRTMGGEHPFPPVGTPFTQHNPFASEYETNRRSVYLMTRRSGRHPFLGLFDGADTNATTPRRSPTLVPTQALYFMNDPFVHEQSAGLARHLLATGGDDAARIALAYEMTLAREPRDSERARARDFLDRYRRELEAAGAPAEEVPGISWSAFARTLFASSEFLFID